MENIPKLMNENNLTTIYKNYSVEQITSKLSFKESMYLSNQMLINKECDDDIRNFAVDLLQHVREQYPEKWNLDWKNDLFLGDACHITMRYNERYEAYKRASLKFKFILPPNLLISLARCYLAPGKAPISIYEAEKLVIAALEKEKSIEAVTLIRGICKTQKREDEFAYWDKILKELKEKGAYMKNEWPELLNVA